MLVSQNVNAREESSLPDELVLGEDLKMLVDQRWRDYFPGNL